MSKAKEDLKSDKPSSAPRPPSSMSTGSADSGVFSSGVQSQSQGSQGSSSSGSQSGPPSPTAQLNSLLFQTANLLAVNEQLRKEIAENKHIQSIQMRALSKLSSTSSDPFAGPPISSFHPHHPHQQLPPHSTRPPRGERRMQKPESYKTVICQAWLESKTCHFAENCRFAHGEDELRPSKAEPRQNNKYKTKLCDKYTTTGLCPYGKRCLFIHPDHGPNAYIRADKLFEVSQRHALADLRDQMETQIMTGGRNTFTQLPSMMPDTSPSQQQQQQHFPPPPEATKRAAEGARPHPSWPLETTFAFTPEAPPPTSRAISPFQPYFMTPDVSAPFATMLRSDEDPLASATIPTFDHLAEDMAKHLELW